MGSVFVKMVSEVELVSIKLVSVLGSVFVKLVSDEGFFTESSF